MTQEHRRSKAASLPDVTVSTATASAAQNGFARDALRSQRQRFAPLLRALDDDEWTTQSLCTEWSVHEVVRHLCDVTLKATALLRGQQPEDVGTEAVDPRTTPVDWLARSSGERPRDTLVVLEEASAELLDEVDRHFRDATDAEVPWLYGPVPWSMSTLHVVWDAWLHERDILVPLGRPHGSPPVESRAAAAYGLTMACMPAILRGTPLDETVLLTGHGGGTFRLEARDRTITTTAGDAVGPDVEPLRGALAEVVDSLMGRGPELTEVLHGPAERVDRLARLRSFMLLPASRQTPSDPRA